MRIRFVLTFFAIVWLVLLVRIYYISIKSNSYYEMIAKQNSIKTIYSAPLRGTIKDIKGELLAINETGFYIAIAPHLSKKKKLPVLEKYIDTLVDLFPEHTKEKLLEKYIKLDSPYNHDFIKIINFISYDEAIKHLSLISQIDDIEIAPASKRKYPNNHIASHVIGYVGRANHEDEKDLVAKLTGIVGRVGIENMYNKVLQGVEGKREVKVNARNKIIEEISKTTPQSKDIKLSIDVELQRYISSLFEGISGVAIVMDLEDGSLLSAVSYPEYDINKFVQGISHEEWKSLSEDFNHPFTNKFINGLYPPGSIVKMGVGLAFLDSLKITRNTTFDCLGSIELGGRIFRCHKASGHGETDLNKAIRESCDVYFYEGSLKVGIDSISAVLQRLGFGEKTGVDLPNEFMGTVPSKQWKSMKYSEPWYQGETLNASIGQGYFLSTPLQVARHTAIIATGKNVTPHFIDSIDGEKVVFENSDNIFTSFEKKQLPYIRESMYEVCNSPLGTGYRHVKTSVKVACKTGTAQVIGIPQEEKVRMKEDELKYYQRSHAWFTSYAPYKNPRYVVTVLIEHGGHGGQTGGPTVSKIYDKLIEMGYIKL